jgi:hypothetical protein
VLDHNQSNSTNYNRPQSKGNFYIKPWWFISKYQ